MPLPFQNKEKVMDNKGKKEKKYKADKPVTVHITNNNTFQKGVGAFITNLEHLTIVMDSDGNMKLDASQVPVMPHTEVEVGKDTNDDDQDDDDALAVVGKCFKFMSGYVKGKVGTIVKQYCVSQADLALIEITLYYHGLLYKRNAHKAFAKALVAWGILKAANDDEITAIVNCIKDKYTSLPKEGGYKGWNERFQNDKETCVNIGQELGDTMPYKA
jgi:hypothetical protein